MNNVIELSLSYAGIHEPLEIRRLENGWFPEALRFIDSWSDCDVYDRFGSAGIGGRQWLADEITNNGRRVLAAVHACRIVGLLDYVYALGAIHVGIVVDAEFRRLSIGTQLVFELLKGRRDVTPVSAECRIDNFGAVGLLRRCWFEPVTIEQREIVWNHA